MLMDASHSNIDGVNLKSIHFLGLRNTISAPPSGQATDVFATEEESMQSRLRWLQLPFTKPKPLLSTVLTGRSASLTLRDERFIYYQDRHQTSLSVEPQHYNPREVYESIRGGGYCQTQSQRTSNILCAGSHSCKISSIRDRLRCQPHRKTTNFSISSRMKSISKPSQSKLRASYTRRYSRRLQSWQSERQRAQRASCNILPWPQKRCKSGGAARLAREHIRATRRDLAKPLGLKFPKDQPQRAGIGKEKRGSAHGGNDKIIRDDTIFEDIFEVHINWRARQTGSSIRASKGRETFFPYWTASMSKCFNSLRSPRFFSERNLRRTRFEYEDYINRKFHTHPGTPHNRSPIDLWLELTPRLRRRYWMSALLYFSYHAPINLWEVLVSLMKGQRGLVPTYISRHCVEYFLQFQERLLHSNVPKAEGLNVGDFDSNSCFSLVRFLTDQYGRSGARAFLSQKSIYVLTRYLSFDKLTELLPVLNSGNEDLTPWNIRQLAYRYSLEGRIEEAFNCLRKLSPSEVENEETYRFLVFLLRFEFPADDLYRLRTSITLLILKIGIRPDSRLRSAMILNAIEGGDRQMAWNTHRVIQKNGVPPDAFTYSILLQTIRCGDGIETIASIHRDVKRNGLLHKSPALACSLIDALYRFERQNSRSSPFRTMLRMYSGLFDLKPLQDVGIALEASQTNPQQTELMKPNAQVLGVMMTAWLEENYNSAKMDDVFWIYLYHLRERKSRIAITGHSRHVLHAFMYAYGKRGGKSPICLSIAHGMEHPENWHVRPTSKLPTEEAYLQSGLLFDVATSLDHDILDHMHTRRSTEMFNAADATFARNKPVDDRNSYYVDIPRPNEMTWSILILAFAREGFHSAAEKIMSLMEERGIAPSSITWNNLIDSYSIGQNVDGLVNAMQRKVAAGMNLDEWAMKSAARISDRAALQEAFDRAEHRNIFGDSHSEGND